MSGTEPDEPSTQVAVVDGAGRIALVSGVDGALGLPSVPGWRGEPWLYRAAVAEARAAGVALGPLEAPVTHLAPLHEGRDGVPGVNLVEAMGGEAVADAYWLPDDDLPASVPTEARGGLVAASAAARRAALKAGADGTAATARSGARGEWPPFCLPGATSLVREVIAAEDRLAGRARLQDEGQADEDATLDQVQGWSISSVWRNAELVLKLTNPAWVAEAAITERLSQLAPAHVPEVIAAGVTPVGRVPYFAQRRVVEPPEPAAGEAGADERLVRSVAAIRALAVVQRAAAPHLGDLVATGAEDRTPERTATELPGLWEVVAPVLPEDRAALLPALDERLREGLARLAGTPPVLVHGDLHLGNVLADDDGEPQLIDWTDASVAWPGADAYMTLFEVGEDEARRELLLAAYLDALGPEHELGIRLGLQLAPVYHALSYLRIGRFLPADLGGPFGGAVGRFVARQLTTLGM